MKNQNTSIQHFRDPEFKRPSHKGGRPCEKTSRKYIISTRLTWTELQSVEKALAKSGLNRSDAVRLALLHCVGLEQLPQRIYGGLSNTSGEVYLAISRVRNLLRQIEINLPNQCADFTTEEIFARYSKIAATLGRFVEGIAETIIRGAQDKDQT